MGKEVLVIGELLADLISEEYVNSLQEAKTFRIHQGGSPANVCANLKWLGVESHLVSCVGNDAIGHSLIESISKLGLDARHISKSNLYPTSLVLVSKSNTSPDFIAYRMADTQIPAVDQSLIGRCDIIHTSAFALSRQPARDHIFNAFHQAASNGKTISADWNFAPGIWRESGEAVFEKLCSYKPLLKISLDDVTRFLNRPVTATEAMSFLQHVNTTVTCLTCGADGVWFKNSSTDWSHKPAIKVSHVKDVTGAGDAFWSGFLWAHLSKLSLDLCVDNGLNLAARKIQKTGPLYVN